MTISISKLNPKFLFCTYLHCHTFKLKIITPNIINFNVFVILCIQMLLINENFANK